jgi:hypothetical protein
MKFGTGKVVLCVWAYRELHFSVYRENWRYCGSKELLCKMCVLHCLAHHLQCCVTFIIYCNTNVRCYWLLHDESVVSIPECESDWLGLHWVINVWCALCCLICLDSLTRNKTVSHGCNWTVCTVQCATFFGLTYQPSSGTHKICVKRTPVCNLKTLV